MDKYQLLQRYWGYAQFRPLQELIVDAVAEGHDTLVLLPTGGGKSLCYQLPALLRDGLCLVVSPLIALMKDQVQQLQNRHLRAACLVSGMSSQESTAVLYNAMAGELKYLYVSPERLRQRKFIEHLRHVKVGLIAVDEAHCISQWGYDFRPPYLQIAEVRQYFPKTPVVALTATATPEVQEDICRQLQMHDCRRFVGSFYRANLAYKVVHAGNKTDRLLYILRQHEGSGIVYVRNRRQTKAIADFLSLNSISATYYHAGLDTAERDRRQSMWMEGGFRVMVATNAFGMGIDKADVRFVVHMDLPDSLEAYFQEAGRAGRDGQPAEAVLVYDDSDIARNEKNLEIDFPSVKYIRNVYRALCNHYQLPMGSGADAQFDFDLEEICKAYNLNAREFYSACRFLEREGVVSLPEREDAYSTLYIPLGRDEVYRFQVDHLMMGDLLQRVIRMYPGLFTGATPIDERRVASQGFLETSEVVRLLQQMSDMHVVEYRPRPTRPQIIFTSARVNENELFLNDTNRQMLQQAARQRVEAMQAYVQNDKVCRSKQLLAYFGEKEARPCGCCDVCQRTSQKDEEVETAAKRILHNCKMSLAELCARLEKEGYVEVQEVVRQLMDRGEVQMDENLFLSVK